MIKVNYTAFSLFFFSALSSTLLSASVQAEQSKYKQLMAMDLGDMLKVKVATGTDKQLSEAPAVVSIITAEDILLTGAATLEEALLGVPGIHLGYSINSDQRHANVRGIATPFNSQILILIDGVNVSNAYIGAPSFGFNYPVSAIERIEVIRGPGSAVYGADAFTGVVNVITKHTNSSEASLGGSYGSFDTKELWANINYLNDDFSLSLAVNHSETGSDDNREVEGEPLSYGRNVDNIHIDIGYGDFTLENWYQKTNVDYGISLGIWVNDHDRTESKNHKTKLGYHTSLTSQLSIDTSIAYTSTDYFSQLVLFPSGTYGIAPDGNFDPFSPTQVEFPSGMIGNPGAKSETLRFDAAAIYSLADHRLRIAVGAENTDGTGKESKNFGPGVLDSANFKPISDTVVDVTGTEYVWVSDYDRQLWYISLQDEWKFAENWELTAGVRFDDYSDFGSTTNPRAALVWKTHSTLTTKLLYGSAFRAPSFIELTSQNNPVSLGNKDLAPETMDTTEIAFDYRPTPSLNVLLNLYYYQVTDLISLVPDHNAPGTVVNQNVLDQEGRGVELEGKWQVTEQLSVNANLSMQQSEDTNSGYDKALVPSTMANIDLRYKITNELTATLQSYWVSGIQREFCDIGVPAFNETGLDCANTEPRAEVDDYTITDINLVYSLANHWTARLNVKNLFDEKYYLPTPSSSLFLLGFGVPGDIPMRGRAINATVEYVF